MGKEKKSNVWIEVRKKGLVHNLRKVRSFLRPQTKVLAVIKQNAYGHGMFAVAKILEKNGVDFFGVHNKDEALALRRKRIKAPILILSNVLDYSCFTQLIKQKIRISLMDYSALPALNRAAASCGRKALVHIKIDTGMNRLGVGLDKACDFVEKARKYKNIVVEGVFSHLACVEESRRYTLLQIKRFQRVLECLKRKKISIPLIHLANSAAILKYKEAEFNMVRAGIILYGENPTSLPLELSHPLSFKAKVLLVKEVKAGECISYGCTYKTKHATRIGVVAVGYALGFTRALSNRSYVLIGGKKRKVLGRVCMDHIIVDLGKDKIKAGTEAVIIGRQKNEIIAASDLARRASTISYEIFTSLPADLPRIYY